ncbi:MAG TPA: sialate O-acetylesterase [Planctomycetota bacterium]|nr:sialate O-acetylesterase [Planctomycetota bacterium]
MLRICASSLLRPGVFLGAAIFFAAGAPSSDIRAEQVQHLVLFEFQDGTSDQDLREILEAFEQLPAKIPGIVGFQWGQNNSPEGLAKGLTHGFVVTFESAAARDAYLPHEEHKRFGAILRPHLKDVFVLDFAVPKAPPAAEPGRVQHLVFFKFKDGASKADVDSLNVAFAELPRQVSGLIHFQSGPDTSPEKLSKGFTHGYLLTFANERARDDYVVHPAHKAFVSKALPILAEPLVLDFTVAPSSRRLLVTGGVEPYAVLQRGPDGTAQIEFSGISRESGPMEARLLLGRRTVAGFDWKVLGKAEGGRFQGAIPAVPAGGEYTLEIRRRDALGNVAEVAEVGGVLVGDVWILAGQSNMEGVGDLEDVETPSPLVHCFTMAHRWELAAEPLHWLIDSPDPVHLGDQLKGLDEDGRRERRAQARASRKKGAGLGLSFAKELAARTGVPIGLIASAHGGTSMAQWSPSLREQDGASLYGSMLKQVRNGGGKVKGVLWYQGESDANPDASSVFGAKFQELVAAFRSDLKNPALPFYYVQIGRFVLDGGSGEHWNRVQELQRTLEKEIPGTAVVPVIDLALDDLIHVGTPGLKRVGRRLAKIAHRELFGAKGIERGPRLSKVEASPDGRTLRVHYSEVNGRLLPELRVEGFSIRKKDGSEVRTIYNASVDRSAHDTVVLKLQNPPPEGAVLHYGWGLDPICNLVDAEDMAAPVFGPIEIRR